MLQNRVAIDLILLNHRKQGLLLPNGSQIHRLGILDLESVPHPLDLKKQVKDAVRNYTSFLDKNFIKDGKLDEEGLGGFFAEFYGKKEVNKLIRGRSKAEGKEELIEKDLKKATKSPSITSKSSIASDEQLEIGRQLLGKNIF